MEEFRNKYIHIRRRLEIQLDTLSIKTGDRLPLSTYSVKRRLQVIHDTWHDWNAENL